MIGFNDKYGVNPPRVSGTHLAEQCRQCREVSVATGRRDINTNYVRISKNPTHCRAPTRAR